MESDGVFLTADGRLFVFSSPVRAVICQWPLTEIDLAAFRVALPELKPGEQVRASKLWCGQQYTAVVLDCESYRGELLLFEPSGDAVLPLPRGAQVEEYGAGVCWGVVLDTEGQVCALRFWFPSCCCVCCCMGQAFVAVLSFFVLCLAY